jgi:hypothetical protein
MYGDPIPVTLTDRLACIVAGLLNVVGKHARGGLLWVIGGLVGSRIMKARNRVLTLIHHLEAGTLRQHLGRKEPATKPPPKPMNEETCKRLAEAAKIWGKIPRKWGWLVGLVGWEAAGYAGQLSHWLQDPEMQKHLAATPRMAKALRPICKMLGIDPTLLGEPPAEPKKLAEAAGASTGRPRRGGKVMGSAPLAHPTGCADAEPSRAEIKRIIATRRAPSIEMQANPRRYPWYPTEEVGTGETEKNSG